MGEKSKRRRKIGDKITKNYKYVLNVGERKEERKIMRGLCSDIEIYNVLLSKARNGCTKWWLLTSVNISKKHFREALKTLLEKRMLTCDESNFIICKNGSTRRSLYKTSKEGFNFLQKFSELEQYTVQS